MSKIYRKDLVKMICSDLNLENNSEVDLIIKCFLNKIIEQVSLKNDIILSGFGNFKVQTHKGHYGANIKNISTDKTKIFIDDYLSVKFKASVNFKRCVRCDS